MSFFAKRSCVPGQNTVIPNPEIYYNYPVQHYPDYQPSYFYSTGQIQNFQSQVHDCQDAPGHYNFNKRSNLSQHEESGLLNHNFPQTGNLPIRDLQQKLPAPKLGQHRPDDLGNVFASDPSQISSASSILTPGFLQYQRQGYENSLKVPKVSYSRTSSESAIRDRYVDKKVKYFVNFSNQLFIQPDENVESKSDEGITNTGNTSSSAAHHHQEIVKSFQFSFDVHKWKEEIGNGSRSLDEFGINLSDLPEILPVLNDSDLSELIFTRSPTSSSILVDNFASRSCPDFHHQHRSKTPSIAQANEDYIYSYPVGPAVQTKVLESSEFMLNFPNHIDHRQATREPVEVVQPHHRRCQKEEVPASIPDIVQMDLAKLDRSETFFFGSKDWILSFDRNPKFKEFFFAGLSSLRLFICHFFYFRISEK